MTRLRELSVEWVLELEITKEMMLDKEVPFTSEVLLPWLRRKVKGLNKPGLYVRGDGGPAVHNMHWHGFDFYPDLAIVQDNFKLIGFEVKLIRQNDSSAPLTKAIGQTMVYSRLGFNFCHGLVFDLRNQQGSSPFIHREVLISSENAQVHVYR